MAEATFACPKCRQGFNVEPNTEHIESLCPNCASHLDAYFFPAFFRPPQVGAVPTALVDHTEASCFYHPQKQAMRVCDGCGRMLCSLCSIELGDEHLCPSCISSGRKKGKITTLEGQRTRYDSIALILAAVGIIPPLMAFSVVAAPASIYIAIRHWNSPGSLLGRSRTRFVVAIVLSIVEIVFWIVIIALIIVHPGRRHH